MSSFSAEKDRRVLQDAFAQSPLHQFTSVEARENPDESGLAQVSEDARAAMVTMCGMAVHSVAPYVTGYVSRYGMRAVEMCFIQALHEFIESYRSFATPTLISREPRRRTTKMTPIVIASEDEETPIVIDSEDEEMSPRQSPAPTVQNEIESSASKADPELSIKAKRMRVSRKPLGGSPSSSATKRADSATRKRKRQAKTDESSQSLPTQKENETKKDETKKDETKENETEENKRKENKRQKNRRRRNKRKKNKNTQSRRERDPDDDHKPDGT